MKTACKEHAVVLLTEDMLIFRMHLCTVQCFTPVWFSMDICAFWSWFNANQQRFVVLRHESNEALLDEILTALQQYSPGLWFEVGGHPDGSLELVISAEGDRTLFAAASMLVEGAPSMPGWRIIAFRPPHGFNFVTRYEGMEIDPAACWFLPFQSRSRPGEIGLRVAVPGYDEEIDRIIATGVYIVVETGLGELVMGERIAFIETCAVPPSPESEGFIPLNELGDYVASVSRRSDM